jgi:hypothetical protein
MREFVDFGGAAKVVDVGYSEVAEGGGAVLR